MEIGLAAAGAEPEFFVTPSGEYSWQLDFCAIALSLSLCHCRLCRGGCRLQSMRLLRASGIGSGSMGQKICFACLDSGLSWTLVRAEARECLILLGSHKPGLGSENLSENTEREMREREDEINQNIALTVPQSEGQWDISWGTEIWFQEQQRWVIFSLD